MPIVAEIASRALEAGVKVGVDLGCGDGRNLKALRERGLDLAGLDISPTALTRADQLLRAGGDGAPLILGDVTALPFAEGTLDLVTALDVAGQIPDPAPLIAEAHRVLRPGGMLVANFFTLDDDTHGEGEEVEPHTFLYRETLFRYFERAEVQCLFAADWQLEIQETSWVDPPHGSFRPYRHRHVNHVVYASA
ncbi:MAG TPA: class I SAM-dependent methyltransferase [Solirubrobacterales bacterium]|nr:class I SAM-dependent methyltransferase [Solirubrobacterales bacterium]